MHGLRGELEAVLEVHALQLLYAAGSEGYIAGWEERPDGQVRTINSDPPHCVLGDVVLTGKELNT